MPPPHLSLLGRDGCARTAALRGLLDGLGVAFTYVPLDGTALPDDPCGYVSPSLRIAPASGPAELLVQPPVSTTLDALTRYGLLRRRAHAAGRSLAR